jgi:hypothetical protein
VAQRAAVSQPPPPSSPSAPTPPAPAVPGQSVITPSDRLHPRKLSEEFALIVKEFEVETVTLREVFGLLHGRGYVLLVMLLALPFCTPIPLPGLSTPLGLIILIISTRLALGAKPWLPQRLLDTRLPPNVFAKVFEITGKIVRSFEGMLRPRLLWVTASPRLEQLHALPMMLCAVLLLLPLPVPFTNIVPAWAIILVAGGLLERDGYFILGGYAATLLTAVFFGAIALFGKSAVEWMWAWMK